jgi:hypothetical protein
LRDRNLSGTDKKLQTGLHPVLLNDKEGGYLLAVSTKIGACRYLMNEAKSQIAGGV